MTEIKTSEHSSAPENRDSNSAANRYWRSQPNDTRETWAFLVIGQCGDGITSEQIRWKLDTGNPTKIVQLYRDEMSENATEPSLYEKLDGLRKNGATLFTPTAATLQYLRTYLLVDSRINNPTLRGFDHAALVEIVNRHFASPDQIPLPMEKLNQCSSTGKPADELIEACWEVRTTVGHLVPNAEICGDPL